MSAQGHAVEATEGQIPNDAVDERSRFSDTATSLLREYIGRLEEMRRDVESILQQLSKARKDDVVDGIDVAKIRLQNLQTWYSGFQRSSVKLSRTVSQRLQHSELDDTVRMELDVRLADLEGSLSTTGEALSSTTAYAHSLRR